MVLDTLQSHKTALVVSALLFFMAVSIWLRAIPEAYLVDGTTVNLFGADPWYNLRQIEVMVAHFPQYDWFDPMTAYPTGKEIGWGPLFPFLAAAACLMVGATARPEIMYIAAWIPPILAATMVPLLYLVGTILVDRKTGVIAAGIISFASISFFFRSSFGFVDHHVAEVVFSTLFCLTYIAALAYAARHPPSFQDHKSLIPVSLLALASGGAYLLGLLTMPTIILFALIAGLFSVIQFIRNHLNDEGAEGLLLINGITFAVPIVFLLSSGILVDSPSLSQYSVSHVYAYALLIGASVLLYGISRVLQGRRYAYIGAVAFLGVAAGLVLVIPDLMIGKVMVDGLISFFGPGAAGTLIREMGPWDFPSAWQTFNWGLLLMIPGLGILLVRTYRKNRPELLFAAVWSAIILIATLQHLRFEYYLAANLALLAAIAIASAIDYGGEATAAFVRSPGQKEEEKNPTRKKQTQKSRKVRGNPGSGPKVASVLAVLVIAALFVGTSVANDVEWAEISAARTAVSEDWLTALAWMNTHTPDPGVDYYGAYQQEAFRYPETTYGVMSWWDYGHWITFVAQRIPNTNPFQDHVTGPGGAANFFLAPSEETATKVLDAAGSRYIVTDGAMATDSFPAIASWLNVSAGIQPYSTYFLQEVPGRADWYSVVSFYDPEYYQTMAVRLQMLDGSMTEPSDVQYIEYDTVSTQETGYPRLIDLQTLGRAEAQAKVDAYSSGASGTRHAALFGESEYAPIDTIPALRHYRLIYESSPDAETSVKIFEYVPGAVIKGEGTIELPLVTNTGREFVYRQQSTDGAFIVPYSTSGTPYGVTTTGQYRIVGTGTEFAVPEDAVATGATIGA